MPTWGPIEWSAVASAIAASINVILVVVLVAATIYYARQTKATVDDELREARAWLSRYRCCTGSAGRATAPATPPAAAALT